MPNSLGSKAEQTREYLPLSLPQPRPHSRTRKRKSTSNGSPENQHGATQALAFPFQLSRELSLVGQSFSKQDLTCLRAYTSTIHSSFPWVEASQVFRGITFSFNSLQGRDRVKMFASRSAAWAATAIGAAFVGKQPNPYLNIALQGVSEFYDCPTSDSISALIAICWACRAAGRKDLLSRYMYIVETLTCEMAPTSFERIFMLWILAKTWAAQSSDSIAQVLEDRAAAFMSSQTFPMHLRGIEIFETVWTLLGHVGTVLEFESLPLSSQQKWDRLYSTVTFLQAMPMRAGRGREGALPVLLSFWMYALLSFCNFRMGCVEDALWYFTAQVKLVEENPLILRSSNISLHHRILLHMVRGNGGPEAIVKQAQRQLGQFGSRTDLPEDGLDQLLTPLVGESLHDVQQVQP